MSQIHILPNRGGSRGGVLFGNPKLHKEGKKTLRVCVRKRRILVLNSHPDPPPPLSKILYPPLPKMSFFKPTFLYLHVDLTYTPSNNEGVSMLPHSEQRNVYQLIIR